MGRINVLDPITANAIKAGEVIERPVSVVKELFDNSADAGASVVRIEFTSGGIGMIRVSDNGIGMDREDAEKCFLIHATSKLKDINDIYNLSTQGFRGEALASIAACADVTLVTKLTGADVGTRVTYEDGKLTYIGDGACDCGTTVEVRSLFKNIPARYKFLKKDSTEGMYICQLVEKLAMINPHISVKLVKDGKLILSTPGNGELLDTIYSIYGKDTAESLKLLSYQNEKYRISGYVGKPSFVRGNRGMQCIFVNDRPIKNQTVTAAIDEAYKNTVMKGKFPVCFLMIYCPPGTVDVNVHPQKAEVRFDNESDIFRLVYHGIRSVLFDDESAQAGFDRPAPAVIRPETNSMSHKLSSSGTSQSPAAADAKAIESSNKLLELLSAYRPDVSSMTGETSESDDVTDDQNVESDPVQIHMTEVMEESQQIPSGMSDDIRELLNSDYIGTLFATYLIFQSDGNVFFVDQHAAHERVLYERFMNRKIKDPVNPDNMEYLLVPQMIELSSSDYTFVSDNILMFKDNGYDIDLMDNRQIVLRAVPMMKGITPPARMFEQVLNDLKHDTPDKGDVWFHLIQTTACKAAVKAGDVLALKEINELIEQMSVLEDPYHCAHGRPTFFKFSRTDLERRFKRIV
ncbi:DNA mismatch repair protein MutL [Ruminococcaceae bacterium YRB3002]|nr:DNA mismatch repair protein MutL [Ruminococcaceae bacterium YRB3002]